MRLHLRLALPLLIVAVTVTILGSVGVFLLVGHTFDIALEQQQRQFARIVSNTLQTQSQALEEVAAILVVLDGHVGRRVKEWKHVALDAAVIIDSKTGQVKSRVGEKIERRDLDRVQTPLAGGLLLLRTSSGILVAGTKENRRTGECAIAAKLLDRAFVNSLRDTLQCEAEITADGAAPVTTTEGPRAEESFPITVPYMTPGGGEVKLTMHVAAGQVRTARRRALFLAIAGGLGLLIVGVAFYLYTATRVNRPIRELIAATDRIAAGDLEARLPSQAPAELGALMGSFDRMARDLRRTQERLVHSAKLSSVGQMVAGVSHELNNPLSIIISHAEYQASQMQEGDAVRRELDVILDQSQRMKRILADLRGHLRPSESARGPVDLNQVVQEVLALVRHDAEKSRVKCENHLQPDLPRTTGSADQIRQVVLNLALNALQAMPDGGRLLMETTSLDNDGSKMVRLAVRDTGQGIRAEDLPRVTEPFFSTKSGRIGLGLAISQDIARQHGGSLLLHSKLGTGTEVVLELPGEPRA